MPAGTGLLATWREEGVGKVNEEKTKKISRERDMKPER